MVAGKYELVEEIGRGGMGTVWRAYSHSLGLDCALKMVLPENSLERERARLLREARLAAKLRSPYVVTIHDVGEWEGSAFVVMELLEGESLRQLLTRTPRLPASVVVELVRQLALGLDKAHAAGLVHRDIKPDNIFVIDTQPLLVKLLDFGVAKYTSLDRTDAADWQTMTGAIVGTPLYMSPEQIGAAVDLDYRTDLWSLAAVIFECLAGQTPFNGQNWPQLLLEIVSGPMPMPSQVNVMLPTSFDACWMQMAKRNPTERPANALALAELVRQAFEPEQKSSSDAHPSPRLVPRLAVASALAVLLGGALYAFRQGSLAPEHIEPLPIDEPVRRESLAARVVTSALSLEIAGTVEPPSDPPATVPSEKAAGRKPTRPMARRSGSPGTVAPHDEIDQELGF